MSGRLGIEFLSVFSLPPVETVNLAADLGCRHISAVLAPIDYNPHHYAPYSLREDAALRREMVAAMRDRDVSVSLGEGLAVWPGQDVSALAADLDIMCELGAKCINAVSFDPDLTRSFDQIAKLVEMVDAAGLPSTVECVPGMTIADLPTALAVIRHVNRPNFRLLVDVMHIIRSGSTVADLAALDPELFGYIQLCDVPLVPVIPNYMEEAMFERRPPGKGELPLREILDVLPKHLTIGLEIPQRALAEAGVSPYERLRPAVEAARALLV